MRIEIFLLLIITAVGALAGQLSLKAGMNRLGGFTITTHRWLADILRVLFHPLVMLGLGLYFLSTVLWMRAISEVKVSQAYPVLSVGSLITVAASALILRERVSLQRILGAVIIAVGVYLVVQGG